MKKPTTVFLGVDIEDQKRVADRFPSAKVIEEPLTGKELIAACKDAEVISVFINSPISREVLEELPKLKLLCTRSVGYNHIDLLACQEKGILVCNVPDYGSHVISEHVFALLLSTLRHISKGDEQTEKGKFDYHGLRGMALKEKTIGIIGTGKIGRGVAEIAHGFGMHILAVDRCRQLDLSKSLGMKYLPLEELLAKSDIITLHVPANDETFHMLNPTTFRQMKDGVIIVNTARGELIDSGALIRALNSGKVAHALLDVFEHEQNFKDNKELVEHPNVVSTPHIAFYAEESMHNMYEDCFTSIDEWASGDVPEHIVKPKSVVCDLEGVKKK